MVERHKLELECKCGTRLIHNIPPVYNMSYIVCSSCEDKIGCSSAIGSVFIDGIDIKHKPDEYSVRLSDVDEVPDINREDWDEKVI